MFTFIYFFFTFFYCIFQCFVRDKVREEFCIKEILAANTTLDVHLRPEMSSTADGALFRVKYYV